VYGFLQLSWHDLISEILLVVCITHILPEFIKITHILLQNTINFESFLVSNAFIHLKHIYLHIYILENKLNAFNLL
jgi:hypothetical protein